MYFVFLVLRYLVVLVTDTDHNKPAKLDEKCVYLSISNTVRYLHGVFGDAAVHNGLCVKYINKHTGLVVIRARRGTHRLLASALPMVRTASINNKETANISISTLYTGACVKQCLLFIKRYQMDEYHKAAVTMSEEERQELKEMFMNYSLAI